MDKKCINDEKSYYKGNEPSPKGFGYCAHVEKENTVKIGKNKKLWIVKLYETGMKRWTLLKGYFTHENGSRPYFVNKNSNTSTNIVKIYANKFNKKMKIYEYVELINIPYQKIIVGKSSGKNTNTKFFDGNTILLLQSPNRYIYIGNKIYQFEITDKFVKYYSIVGNADTPYPIMLGDKNIYFMLDQKFIPLENFPPKIDWENAYSYFYGFGPDKIKYEKFSKKMIKIKKIN